MVVNECKQTNYLCFCVSIELQQIERSSGIRWHDVKSSYLYIALEWHACGKGNSCCVKIHLIFHRTANYWSHLRYCIFFFCNLISCLSTVYSVSHFIVRRKCNNWDTVLVFYGFALFTCWPLTFSGLLYDVGLECSAYLPQSAVHHAASANLSRNGWDDLVIVLKSAEVCSDALTTDLAVFFFVPLLGQDIFGTRNI